MLFVFRRKMEWCDHGRWLQTVPQRICEHRNQNVERQIGRNRTPRTLKKRRRLSPGSTLDCSRPKKSRDLSIERTDEVRQWRLLPCKDGWCGAIIPAEGQRCNGLLCRRAKRSRDNCCVQRSVGAGRARILPGKRHCWTADPALFYVVATRKCRINCNETLSPPYR